MWGVSLCSPLFLFLTEFRIASSASLPASASPALGLQIGTAVPGFYMGAGGTELRSSWLYSQRFTD